MNVILFRSGAGDPERWREEVTARLPDVEWRAWPEVGDPKDIEVVLLFRAEPGFFGQFPNLKAILSTGAGIDGLFRDPGLPRHLPVSRIVDPQMTEQMVQWSTYAVLHFHRRFDEYRELQDRGEWLELDSPVAGPAVAGILGCGEIGSAVGRGLAAMGFEVRGWTRTPRDLGDIECFAGEGQLDAFLAGSHYLVCLLPLTEDTRGILNRDLFGRLPRGASVINLARGGHLAQEDLLAALEEGQIRGAALDVTEPEPLPSDHPLWRHPRVLITPHVSGITTPETAADQVAENIRRIRQGLPLVNAVDLSRGY